MFLQTNEFLSNHDTILVTQAVMSVDLPYDNQGLLFSILKDCHGSGNSPCKWTLTLLSSLRESTTSSADDAMSEK